MSWSSRSPASVASQKCSIGRGATRDYDLSDQRVTRYRRKKRVCVQIGRAYVASKYLDERLTSLLVHGFLHDDGGNRVLQHYWTKLNWAVPKVAKPCLMHVYAGIFEALMHVRSERYRSSYR